MIGWADLKVGPYRDTAYAAVRVDALRPIGALPPHLTGAFEEPVAFQQVANGYYFVFDRRGIDTAFAEIREFQIGSVFFFQSLTEDISSLVQSEFSGPRDERSIASDLVVLDCLSG